MSIVHVIQMHCSNKKHFEFALRNNLCIKYLGIKLCHFKATQNSIFTSEIFNTYIKYLFSTILLLHKQIQKVY